MKNTIKLSIVAIALLSLVALAAVGFAKMGVPAENTRIVFTLGFLVVSSATVFFNLATYALIDKE